MRIRGTKRKSKSSRRCKIAKKVLPGHVKDRWEDRQSDNCAGGQISWWQGLVWDQHTKIPGEPQK